MRSLGYVSLVSLAKLYCVLVRSYDLDGTSTADIVARLLESREIVVSRADAVCRALRLYRTTTADMADCLIDRLGRAAFSRDGCEATSVWIGVNGKPFDPWMLLAPDQSVTSDGLGNGGYSQADRRDTKDEPICRWRRKIN